jgi:hypothetical protein
MDLEKFEQFKRKFDPSFTNKNSGNSGPSLKWPTGSNQPKQQSNDDDLYS